jgi:hypothetical protein
MIDCVERKVDKLTSGVEQEVPDVTFQIQVSCDISYKDELRNIVSEGDIEYF